ncbi:MAG: hypothetical protein ATN35_04775 [Epulopiscium sp. Nele67-Bin004]|nr:MAG: hypothetical protein ATN35_04775 [Epulopiscium sp. Nele67-Bin004]
MITEISDETLTLKLMNNWANSLYYYQIYSANNKIGKINIRIGYNQHTYYDGHIEYEIDIPYRGHKYSYYASKLAFEVAKAHNMDYVYITCCSSNIASKKIIEQLDGKLLETCNSLPIDFSDWYENIKPYCIYKIDL